MENIPMNPSRVPRPAENTAYGASKPYPLAMHPPLASIPPANEAPMPVAKTHKEPPMPYAAPPSEMDSAYDRHPNHPSDQIGEMPERGMLANTYVPYQKPGRQYSRNEGIKKGTLFPGLDLPFKNYISTRDVANTPLGELMAVGFAIGELGLYLDTHPNDMEALQLRNSYIKMYEEGKKAYELQYGPISHVTVTDGKYDWLKGPWPWEER